MKKLVLILSLVVAVSSPVFAGQGDENTAGALLGFSSFVRAEINDPLTQSIRQEFYSATVPTIADLQLEKMWSCRWVPIGKGAIKTSKSAHLFVHENGYLFNLGEWPDPNNYEHYFGPEGFVMKGANWKQVFRKTASGDLVKELYSNSSGTSLQNGIAYPNEKVIEYGDCRKTSLKKVKFGSLNSLQEKFISGEVPTQQDLKAGKYWSCQMFRTLGNVYRLGLADKVQMIETHERALIFDIPDCWGEKDCTDKISMRGKLEKHSSSGSPIFKFFQESKGGITTGNSVYRLNIRVEDNGNLIAERTINNSIIEQLALFKYLAPTSLAYGEPWVSEQYITCRVNP